MPTIVVSAVNLTEGGTLKVLQDCLRTIRATLPDWRVVALVNHRGVIDVDGVEIIEMPGPKRSWLRRVYAEYVEFHQISKTLNADIWWSLHDMTPRVKAGSQFVYCHNPAPFYRFSLTELRVEPKLIPFAALYSLFYRINIRANRAVIVQQDWLRREFKRRYGVHEVIVAHPVDSAAVVVPPATGPLNVFAYPSLPRAFKNFELICEAARLLEREADWRGRILLTLEPGENAQTRALHDRYGRIRGLEFTGRQDREGMNRLYAGMDCLLFPSRLETWGLPITEAKALGKAMIVADLAYAHETVGSYDHVRFVDPGDPRALADLMLEAHRHGWSSDPERAAPIPQPYADNWPHLVELVVAMHKRRR